jgi:DNA modification methylase
LRILIKFITLMSIKIVDIKTVKPNPSNPRHIKDHKFTQLVKSIRHFPEMLQLRPIVVDSDNIVLGGNMRLKACIEAGLKEVPIIVASELTEEQQKEFIIKDNVGFGEWDWEQLANEWEIEQLSDWGLDLPIEMEDTEIEAVEDNYQAPDTIETDIVIGDLFEIGEHRLLCGDSTDSDAMAKLMDGEKADMVFTDPPYGVDYHSQNKTMYYGNGKKGKERERIIGDKTTNVYSGFLPLITLFCNGVVYLFCGAGKEKDVLIEIENNEFELINTLIWDKQRFGGQAIGANYKPCFELFYYILPKGNKRNWIGPNNEETIWRLKRDNKTDYHPTQKPIELSAKAINNHSGNLVLDFFLGSGSTMVASHQLKRKCYGMELDPKYCQVIIDRMIKLDPDLKITRNGQPYESI